MRNRKLLFSAAQKTDRDMEEDQHIEEFIDRARGKTVFEARFSVINESV